MEFENLSTTPAPRQFPTKHIQSPVSLKRIVFHSLIFARGIVLVTVREIQAYLIENEVTLE